MSRKVGREGGGSMVCACPLGENEEGEWGILVPRVSSEGVGLDSSGTNTRGVPGVGLTTASWGACGLSGKVRGRKEGGTGEKGKGERRFRLWLDFGVVGVGLLLPWTVILVSTSSAVPCSGSTGSRGQERGGRGGESGREKGTLPTG